MDDPDWVPSVKMTSKQDLQPPKGTQTSHYKRCVNRTQEKLKEGIKVMPAPHQNKTHTNASTSGTCQALFPGGLKTTDLPLSLSKHQLSVSQGPPDPDKRCKDENTQMQVFSVKVEDNCDDQTAQLCSPVKEEEEQKEISQLSTELFTVKKEEEETLIDLPQQVAECPGFVPSPTHSSSSGSTDVSDKWPNGSPAAKSSQSNSLFGKAKISKQDVSEEDTPKGSNQDSESEEKDSPQGSKSVPKAKLHSCDTCGKRFGSLPGLRRHSVMHTGKKPHPCPKCNKRFWTPAEVKRHMMTHTGERPFPCPECHKCFTLPASLKVHQRVHTGEKPHICSVCEKGFTQPGNLRIHERRHTGERPFSCSHCDRTFIDQGHLKKHIRSHTGEKPYLCSKCPMKFISSTELKVHCRIHSKEKNYSCAFCEKKFSQPHNARIHQKIHI